jgi:membrane fusion protein (multidrug efflux system)
VKIYAQMLDLAKQGVDLKQRDVERKASLVKSQSGSQLDLDTSTTNLVLARAQRTPAAAACHRQQSTARQSRSAARGIPPYFQAKAALDQAQRNLDHTVLRAPIDGTATQVDSIQLGRFVTAGAPVFSVIDDTHPWVDANLKESDLTYVANGQPVTMSIDAFPDHTFKGTVGSLSPGTGAQFAILPPQNSTGNFVKVVQRVPVRIYFDANDPAVRKLKAGMSTFVWSTGHKRTLAGLFGFSSASAQEKTRDRRLRLHGGGPGFRRNMVTVCAMTATIMQAL